MKLTEQEKKDLLGAINAVIKSLDATQTDEQGKVINRYLELFIKLEKECP